MGTPMQSPRHMGENQIRTYGMVPGASVKIYHHIMPEGGIKYYSIYEQPSRTEEVKPTNIFEYHPVPPKPMTWAEFGRGLCEANAIPPTPQAEAIYRDMVKIFEDCIKRRARGEDV